MTSYERNSDDVRYSEKMREFHRPTLCVIDENGIDVTKSVCEISEPGSLDGFTGGDNGIPATCDHNANWTKSDEHDLNRESGNNLLIPKCDDDFDLCELKATTARLKLSTRRQSTVAWQQAHLGSTRVPVVLPKFDSSKLIKSYKDTDTDNNNQDDDSFTEERKNRIDDALAWLRSELMQMRSEDERLARQLLSIRHDIHQLKLQRSCQAHREMLEDVTLDMEENHVLNVISDMPIPDSVHDTPLKHLGVTRMHLSARRFSTC
ncbi:protein FAM167A-like isoform X2 [Dreissena polymorpha]|nr:protein FAM167A-like isoform X2 [Dreissena polymorpha]XP_052232028.1 protein FAM167A-like isoform X2 [Dreissena polymorpha]